MRVLGLAAFERDSAAALVVDGRPVAAAQEERFTRIALDPGFPSRAMRYCLFEAGLSSADLDAVVFHEKPLRRFERILSQNLSAFPHSSRSFAKNLFLWLGERLWVRNRIVDELDVDPRKVLFAEHQRALAANAYYGSPFQEAALLTVDDVGEWATATLGLAANGTVRLTAEARHPHSLGLFASAVTQFLGFVPGEDEHKVEALAAHGSPRFAEELGKLVTSERGLFTVDQRPFRFGYDGPTLFGPGLEELLGPPRHAGERLRSGGGDTRDADVAASLQAVLERTVLAIAHELAGETSASNLCFAGAVATNKRLLARLAAEGPFRRLFVPPAPGKAGAALGAALLAHAELEQDGRVPGGALGSFLGEGIDDRAEPDARALADGESARGELLARLADGRAVGWVHGKMEFGPRSLGQRCVLASAAADDARVRLFAALQTTETFLPCCVAVPAGSAATYFELPAACPEALRAGHLVVPAKPALVAAAPSAVQPDGGAWPLVVDEETSRELYALLRGHAASAGAPLLFLADLRPRGSSLVRNEADAVEAFRRSGLDCLVVGTRIYERD